MTSILKHSETCSYCAEMSNNKDSSYFLSEISDQVKIKSRYLFESETFKIFPSLGALVAGHILIVPKIHITAMSYLNAKQIIELKGVIDEIGGVLRSIYKSNVIAMEHGVIDENKSSSMCVSHAHLHMLPINIDLVGAIKQDVWSVDLANFIIKNYFDKDYILFSNDLMNYYAGNHGELPSQFLRKVVFEVGELEGSWNWKLDLRTQLLEKTIFDINLEVIKNIKHKITYKWIQPS